MRVSDRSKEMRDRIERFVLLPFSTACVSESSVAVGAHEFPNSSNRNSNSTPASNPEEYEDDDDEESLSDENLKSPRSLLAAPKFQRLFKNFKNISQLFVYKDDDDEDDDMRMEIGFPTDVKHVTHIGIDGSTTSILSKGWDNLKEPELNPRPSVSYASSEPTPSEKLNL